jgi:hypothetical protein
VVQIFASITSQEILKKFQATAITTSIKTLHTIHAIRLHRVFTATSTIFISRGQKGLLGIAFFYKKYFVKDNHSSKRDVSIRKIKNRKVSHSYKISNFSIE